jgi:putative ABC transport system permease protein
MMMSVLERTGEIGTVMALGTRRAAVLRGFLIEGALLGLLGALLGVVVALVLGQVLVWAEVEMPPPPGFARSYLATLLITPAMVLETVLIACITTTVASFYPAMRASRMVIVDAIRNGR